MELEEQKLEQRKEKLLEQARKEAKQIIEEGKKRAKEVEKEMLQESRAEARKIVNKGKDDVKKLHDDMKTRIQNETVTLAKAMTKRLLQSILSPKEQHSIVEEHIKKLKKLHA